MKVLLAASNLNARVRLEATGAEVTACRADQIAERLQASTYDALVVDLDEAGDIALPDSAPEKVLGYYSHVDKDIATRARAAGIDAYPRSRFWRETAELLA